jgi:hypothetical protein
LICRLAKYVANGVLSEDEMREVFLKAAEAIGALAQHGDARFHDTLSRGLKLGRATGCRPLPDVSQQR